MTDRSAGLRTVGRSNRYAGIPLVRPLCLRFEARGDIVRNIHRRGLRVDSNRSDLLTAQSAATTDVRKDAARRSARLLAPGHGELRISTLLTVRAASLSLVAASIASTRVAACIRSPAAFDRKGIEPLHVHRLMGRLRRRHFE